MSRLTLRALLKTAENDAIEECVARWCDGTPNGGRRGAISAVALAMEDEKRVLARIAELPRKLQDLLELFLEKGGTVRAVQDLFRERGESFKSRFDLEATLAALHREAFLWPALDKRWASHDSPCWALPSEIVECVRQYRRRSEKQLRDSLTLRGFLDARHFRDRDPKSEVEKDRAADHARKIYKLYIMPTSMTRRLGRLPESIRELTDQALFRHGGIVEWKDLIDELDLANPPDPEFVGKALEEAMLGTVTSLDLARIGLEPMERAIVVFQEVAGHQLRENAERNVPKIDDELACGGNFVTNVGRFLQELRSSKVQFTADGSLFKASQKRIAGNLLPVPGDFLSPEAQLQSIYRFCLQHRLIDRSGERALRPTPRGAEFEREPLAGQTRELLAHFVEDRSLPGEAFHQVRLRRVLLGVLQRAEPMQWQDAAVLPFLARGAYLARLDPKQAEDFFATRFSGGGYTPTETLQQLCWNLLIWVKRRLFPLGIVDLGMQGGRICALRLSQLGAELLEAESSERPEGSRSSVVVQPDYELLVFSGDDVHDVVHLFDRFARRIKSDHVHQFKLERETVQRGLADGLTLAEILQELTDRARAPIPQNVLYSLEEWAQKKDG